MLDTQQIDPTRGDGALTTTDRSHARPSWPRLMANTIRGYDWGSLHVLAHLQGRDPHGRPEAELWMGAHPMASSVLLGEDGRDISLLQVIEDDPQASLGEACLDRFGPRLPFLLKVLAVARPLSVQVHPSPEQARTGFAREEAAGVPRDAADRVYVDACAKPEMLYAVTSFEALAGLRESHEAGYLVDLLDAPRLAGLRRLLGGGRNVVAAVELLVAWPGEDRAALVAEVAKGATQALGSLHGLDREAPTTRRALEWVLRLADGFPADPLVLGPLLLQLHELAPGGTLFVPAGVPHAYLDGVGVEIMASSDNVVRAGLTPKHVDADALLELLDPVAQPVLEVDRHTAAAGEVVFRPPVEEFQLGYLALTGDDVDDVDDVDDDPVLLAHLSGPQVVLCLTGEVRLSTGEHELHLVGGQSAFLGAQVPRVALSGRGEVFRAGVAQPAAPRDVEIDLREVSSWSVAAAR